MKYVAAILAGVALALATGVVTVAQFNVKSLPAEGFIPETVTIRHTMPDTARVCVEPSDGGIVSCRSIRELRRWAFERPAK
jgi:hypothetical protein